MSDSWIPDLYHRFQDERARPFHDLIDLVQPLGSADDDTDTRVLDLGCGSGELTALAHERLHASTTLGVDSSAAMLERARHIDRPGLRFRSGDLRAIDELDELDAPDPDAEPGWDAIIANASLQWVADHAEVLAAWRGHLRPGGQLAVQVPANADHLSHTTIVEVLGEHPFAEATGNRPPPDPVASVLSPVEYAELLWSLGSIDQSVRLQVYSQVMSSWSDVVQWTSGTALVRVRRVLSEDLYEQFVQRYSERLGEHLHHRSPYFYAFKRILLWARFN